MAGFTLVEMLIVTALVAIVSAAFSTMAVEMFRTLRKVDDRAQSSDLRNILRLALSSKDLCTRSLTSAGNRSALQADQGGSTAVITDARNYYTVLKGIVSSLSGAETFFVETPASGSAKYLPGSRIPVKAIRLQFTQPPDDSDPAVPKALGQIEVSFDGVNGDPAIPKVVVPVMFDLNVAKTDVIGCQSDSSLGGGGGGGGAPPPSPQDMCTSLKGTWVGPANTGYCLIMNQQICETNYGGVWDPANTRCLPAYQ